MSALTETIKHWQGVVDGTGSTRGAGYMPLCAVYFSNYDKAGHGCEGCPVKARVGVPDCGFTAYGRWQRHQERHHVRSMELQGAKCEPGCATCARLSKAVLAALETLA